MDNALRQRFRTAACLAILCAAFCAAIANPPAAHAAETPLEAASTSLEAQASKPIACIIASKDSGTVKRSAKTLTITLENVTIDLSKEENSAYDCAISVVGSESAAGKEITLVLKGTNTIKGGNRQLESLIYASNLNLTVKGSGSLTLIGSDTARGIFVEDGSLTVASGTVNASRLQNGLMCDGQLTLDGGTLNLTNLEDDGLESSKDAVVLQAGALQMRGGQTGIHALRDVRLAGAQVSLSELTGTAVRSVRGSIGASAGSLAIDKCVWGLWCNHGPFTLEGADVSVSHADEFAACAKRITATAGSFTADDCDFGLKSEGSMTLTGGRISTTACGNGLMCFKDATLNGADVSVANADGDAIVVSGKLSITDGSVRAHSVATDSYALYAGEGIESNPTCLKAVTGMLSEGAAFTKRGTVYRVVEGGEDGAVELQSYGSTSTKPRVNAVTYGHMSYRVTDIAAKAFATKCGKKIKAIAIGPNVASIGAFAFSGTTKLRTLNLKSFNYPSASIAKKAFRNCGAKAGAKLVVKCPKNNRKPLAMLLVKKGLSSKVKWR